MPLFSKFILTAAFLVASSVMASAQVPSLEEMREQMLAAGMSPAQVDQALEGISQQLPSLGSEAPATPIESSLQPAQCEDENNNDMCDDEEEDDDESETTRCRVSYLDAITQYTLQNHGTRLGEDPIAIGYTCRAASGNLSNTARLTLLPRSLAGGRRFETALEYWAAVADHGAYDPGLRIRWERIERLPPAARLSRLPRDMRPLIRNGDELESLGDQGRLDEREQRRVEFLLNQYPVLARPVQNRCEDIRRNVGNYYRSEYPDGAVCLVNVPEDDDESEDMPEDEE